MFSPGNLQAGIAAFEPYPAEGRILRIRAGEVAADGPDLSIGMQCIAIPADPGAKPVRFLVAAVAHQQVTLVPFEPVLALRIGDVIRPVAGAEGFAASDALLGRAIDGLARPIDGCGQIHVCPARPRHLAVLDRISPQQILSTGVRALDALLTIGRGQRIGIFAASGVGKTRLVNQILANAECDRMVVCLVGERGREVEALWRSLGDNGTRTCTTLVAATSDDAAPLRVRAVEQALTLAEVWRDQGHHVVLVVDSITRLAMALREIGLIAGEPPTVRAYTPNIFRDLPRIVERCGAARDGGSITALFTVLSETDDADDPLVEVMKSLLDGHIVLSRNLAQSGHFPAIDITRSISRLFDDLIDPDQARAAQQCRAWLARLEESRILIESGMYQAGSDPATDAALAARARLQALLRQDVDEKCDLITARAALIALVNQHD